MDRSFSSIAFKTESNINGIGKFSSAGIIIEFESKLFGIIKNGVKEVRLPLDEILDVKFKKGFLKTGAKIEIRLNNFAKLTELPNKNGRLVLRIVREDYAEAERAIAKLQKDLADSVLAQPKPQSPVSRLFEENDDDLK